MIVLPNRATAHESKIAEQNNKRVSLLSCAVAHRPSHAPCHKQIIKMIRVQKLGKPIVIQYCFNFYHSRK